MYPARLRDSLFQSPVRRPPNGAFPTTKNLRGSHVICFNCSGWAAEPWLAGWSGLLGYAAPSVFRANGWAPPTSSDSRGVAAHFVWRCEVGYAGWVGRSWRWGVHMKCGVACVSSERRRGWWDSKGWVGVKWRGMARDGEGPVPCFDSCGWPHFFEHGLDGLDGLGDLHD